MSNIIDHPCKAPIDRIRELEALLDTAITGAAKMEAKFRQAQADCAEWEAECSRLTEALSDETRRTFALRSRLTCKRHAMRVFLGMPVDDLAKGGVS